MCYLIELYIMSLTDAIYGGVGTQSILASLLRGGSFGYSELYLL